MSERRFLSWIFAVALGLAALAAALCWAVDPYLVFGQARFAGFNHIKPAVTTHEPMMKAYQASRACGKTLIIGSSRSGIGLDPSGPAWPQAMQPVYNLSVAGTNLHDALLLLNMLLAHCQPDRLPTTLVVGLDFESFLSQVRPATAPQPVANDADQQQAERLQALARRTSGGLLQPGLLWRDAATSLLTVSALVDSLATLRASQRAAGPNLLPGGNSSEWQLQAWTQADGAGALFHQKHLLTARRFAKPHQLGVAPDGAIRGMAAVSAMLGLAAQHKMAVKMAVQPSHVSHHELIDALGHWPDFDRWKHALADAAHHARQRGMDVTVWDFGGYEADYLQPVPARGDRRAAMAAFWDPVHYNTMLGQRITAAWIGAPAAPTASSASASESALGAELRPETVAQRVFQVRQARERWRSANPQALADAQRYRCAVQACPGNARLH